MARRNDLSRMHPLEVAITELIWEIEKIGASQHLTQSVIKLSEAKSHLADHIETANLHYSSGEAQPGE